MPDSTAAGHAFFTSSYVVPAIALDQSRLFENLHIRINVLVITVKKGSQRPDSFPAATWRKLFIESLHDGSLQYGQYRDPQGEWRLRCGIREYLERSRGVICNAEQ